MSPRLYNCYLFLTKIKRRIHRKVGPLGRLFIFFTILSLLFGLNTKVTMIYQLAGLLLMLLLFSFPFSFFSSPSVRLHRIVPKTCTAGEKLTYILQLENRSEKPFCGFIFKERSGAEYPRFEDFNSCHEVREKNRNYFDRKLGYYRWLWLLERNAGARFHSFSLPQLFPQEMTQMQVSLLPQRRGYIHLSGFSIYRLDPLGFFKNEAFVKDPEKLLVLPKMFPVVQTELIGSRKYHQGGLTSAASCGESGDVVSLREYRPGDSVKNIDWKVTARVGNTIVRQYQDEYFSRYGLLLDTFTDQEDTIFEDAVSVAASIVVQQDTTKNLIDLLFACDSCISSISMGPGQAEQHTLLEVLACIVPCRDQGFSQLAELVMTHTGVLSGLILVLVKIDEERKQLIDYLESMNIPHRILLISDDKQKCRALLQDMSLHKVRIFDVKSEGKLVDLT